MRYFIPPRKLYTESKHLSEQLYEFMQRLPSNIDKCTKYYVDILLGRPRLVEKVSCALYIYIVFHSELYIHTGS